jgi:hypothetical protein
MLVSLINHIDTVLGDRGTNRASLALGWVRSSRLYIRNNR